MEEQKEYLGDGVYVAMDNGMVRLTVEDGFAVSDTVYLEEEVYEALVEYVENRRSEILRSRASRTQGVDEGKA